MAMTHVDKPFLDPEHYENKLDEVFKLLEEVQVTIGSKKNKRKYLSFVALMRAAKQKNSQMMNTVRKTVEQLFMSHPDTIEKMHNLFSSDRVTQSLASQFIDRYEAHLYLQKLNAYFLLVSDVDSYHVCLKAIMDHGEGNISTAQALDIVSSLVEDESFFQQFRRFLLPTTIPSETRPAAVHPSPPGSAQVDVPVVTSETKKPMTVLGAGTVIRYEGEQPPTSHEKKPVNASGRRVKIKDRPKFSPTGPRSPRTKAPKPTTMTALRAQTVKSVEARGQRRSRLTGPRSRRQSPKQERLDILQRSVEHLTKEVNAREVAATGDQTIPNCPGVKSLLSREVISRKESKSPTCARTRSYIHRPKWHSVCVNEEGFCTTNQSASPTSPEGSPPLLSPLVDDDPERFWKLKWKSRPRT